MKPTNLREYDEKIWDTLTEDTKENEYLKVCILCNGYYNASEELYQLREKLESEVDIIASPFCYNLMEVNKYGLYLYLINEIAYKQLLWSYRDKDCLVYVEEKENGLLVSIRKNQFNNFKKMLDELEIEYDNLDDFIIFNNKANNKLTKNIKNLPFELFDYQKEDINKLLNQKRCVIGHEMGCYSGNSLVEVKVYGRILKLPIRDLLGEDILVKCLNNNRFSFLPGEVIFKGIKKCLRIKTEDTELICTYDHEILTNEGWKEAKDITKEDCIITDIKKNETIISITKDIGNIENYGTKIKAFSSKVTKIDYDFGEYDVYDIAIKDTFIHNVVVNNLIVHNCGKTIIATTVGDSIKGKKLIVCPESLRINWEREILMLNPNAEIDIVYSKDDFKGLQKEWTIMGYHTVTKFEKEIEPYVLIIDEAHFIKAINNWGKPKSKRGEAILNLSEKAEYMYALTGTPIPSKNLDLFNILKLVKSDMYDFNTSSSFFKYVNRYCDPKDTRFGKDYSRNSNSQELHKFLSKNMIRRLKKDVLPHLTKQRQFIPIRPKLTKEYKDIEKRLYEPEENDTFMSLAMTGRKLLSTVKLDATIELAENILDNEEQVVIVTNFIETADKLKAHFKNLACEIRGGIGDKKKQKAVDDFQSGKKKVCILNMLAGGVGITLTKAKYLIMVDYDWTPANNIQVEDRICRTGQTEQCTIYYVYCNNSVFDSVFVKLLTKKAENISKVVDNDDNQFNLEKERNSAYQELEEEIMKAL